MEDYKRVILFTIHCFQCNVLQKKLDLAGVKYEINEDIFEMKKRGYHYAPMLDVDGVSYDFSEALKWLKKIKGEVKENE